MAVLKASNFNDMLRVSSRWSISCRYFSSLLNRTQHENHNATMSKSYVKYKCLHLTQKMKCRCQLSPVCYSTKEYHHQIKQIQMSTFNICKRHSTHESIYKEKGNVILMGSPGSGKTTVGRLLAAKLDKPVVDVDNDFLESHWNMPVANKLSELGSEGFLSAEGEALSQLDVSNSVVSLTGSNPMHKAGMDEFKKSGVVVYLDVKDKDVLNRLEKMKVTRIVGQEAGVPMTEILPYRQQFYESNYDVRILCEAFESPESITNKICRTLSNLEDMQGYSSTREDISQAKQRTFNEVVLEGLAYDGGLYVPGGHLPYLSTNEWARLVPLSYTERALRILEKWIHPNHLHPGLLSDMITKAYNIENFGSDKIVPLERLYKDKQHVDEFIMELFHGPTASFKDGALQLTPSFFLNALQEKADKNGQRYLILVATSGDTGGAVLDGFSKLPGGSSIQVLVLYPEDGISSLQKAQMTSAQGDNVRVVGIQSDFDFCQTSIKQIFNDLSLAKDLQKNHNCKLSAANSINWGRLLPQIVYHISAYLDLVQQGKMPMGSPVDLCVPSGNFGNLMAAYYAKQMGIPFRHLICASNMNNVLTEFFNTGRYTLTGRKLHQTAAPAIDILKSSNLERLIHHITYMDHTKVREYYQTLDTQGYFQLCREDFRSIQRQFKADWCVESSCLSCIADTYKKTGYLLDPHTAVAKVVADKFPSDFPLIIASTAHYAKFAPDVLQALGHSLDASTSHSELFETLEGLESRPKMHQSLKQSVSRERKHHRIIGASLENIVNEIKDFVDVR